LELQRLCVIQLKGENIVQSLYENININKLYFTLIMKGKLGKISKSSFKRHLSDNSVSKDPDKLIGHYLAGLIEGDGSIIVPKTIRNQKGKLLYFSLIDGLIGRQASLHC